MGKPSAVDVAKAGMTTSTIASAGKLNSQQFDNYVALARDASAFVSDVRMQVMESHTAKLESLEFGGRITIMATEGQAVAEEDRGTLVASKVELIAKEIQCEISYTYQLAMDSILRDRARFNADVSGKMALRFALDWDDLLVNADTANTGDSLLKTLNGIVKQTQTNVLDYTLNEQTVTDNAFYAMWLALSPKYRRNKADMRIYCNDDVISAFNKYIASRPTSLGDIRMVNGSQETLWNGVLLKEISCFPSGCALLTSRQNVVVGIYNQIMTYSDEQPSAGVYLVGQRLRTDVKYVEEEGSVLFKGLSPAAGVTTV
jgi:hypothetical protein